MPRINAIAFGRTQKLLDIIKDAVNDNPLDPRWLTRKRSRKPKTRP